MAMLKIGIALCSLIALLLRATPALADHPFFREVSHFSPPKRAHLPLVGAGESAPHTLTLLVRVLNRMMSDGAEPSNAIAWTTLRVRSNQTLEKS
jgi:hypothetical protein